MKMKKPFVILFSLLSMILINNFTFAEPTEDFHIPEPTTEAATGPEVKEYMVYEETKNYAPGSLSGDVDLSTVGKGLFYDGQDFYFFTDTGTMANNFMFNIEGDRFFFGEDGKMVKDQIVSYEDEIYYFDPNGAMYKNRWYALEQVDESDNKITYVDYYFGPTGRAYRAPSSKGLVVKTIDGEKFGFNEDAEKLEGYYDAFGNKLDEGEVPAYEDCVYYFDPTENGAATIGWHYYEGSVRGDEYDSDEEIVLYFDDKTSRKVYARESNTNPDRCITRIIEGQRYMFDSNGVRKNKWYSSEPGRASYSNVKYFSVEYDGYLTKGWFTAVPGNEDKSDLLLDVNKKRHDDDEEMWFYAQSNGSVLRKTIRKIGSYVYAFDDDGVMQEDCLVKVQGGNFIKSYKLEDLYKANVLFDPNETGGNADPDPYGPGNPINLDKTKGILDASKNEQWMYFQGDMDGISKLGSFVKTNSPVKIELNDTDLYYYANSTGGYMTSLDSGTNGVLSDPVKRNKKLIQNGILLKPNDDDNNYGIVRMHVTMTDSPDVLTWKNEIKEDVGQVYSYSVVNSNGEVITKSHTSFKDKQGNYIYVAENGNFIGVYPYKGTWHASASSDITYDDPEGTEDPNDPTKKKQVTIKKGSQYWTYKTDSKTVKYGLPPEAERVDCSYLWINFSVDSTISGGTDSLHAGPYLNGYASHVYDE